MQSIKIISVSFSFDPPFGGHVHFIYLRLVEECEVFSQTDVGGNFIEPNPNKKQTKFSQKKFTHLPIFGNFEKVFIK
jgi:hypothetical protein